MKNYKIFIKFHFRKKNIFSLTRLVLKFHWSNAIIMSFKIYDVLGIWNILNFMTRCIINRPGVAWAVPQSPLLLIHLISDPFVQKLQDTVYPKPEELRIKYVHPPPHATCHVSHPTFHMSCVMCHVSCVICQVSGVRCQVSDVTFFFTKCWS